MARLDQCIEQQRTDYQWKIANRLNRQAQCITFEDLNIKGMVGVIGLSRSLITVGVPSVIVSLWAVPDALTAQLMTQFK